MNYLCIIFTACRRLFGASRPDTHRGSIPGRRWGLSSPDLLFAYPWKKSCGRRWGCYSYSETIE